MSLLKTTEPLPALTEATYDKDVYAWSLAQADLLRRQRYEKADFANIIKEVESLGNEQRHALKSSYRVLLTHLLKSQFQPERRSRSWRLTINRERDHIEDREDDSASLRREAPLLVAEVFEKSARRAARETDLARSVFPADCPYTLDFLRDHDAMPE